MGLINTGAEPGGVNSMGNKYYSGNLRTSHLGKYQFTTLEDAISNFMVSYVGEGKIIGKVSKTDVAFHAQRALSELSYDTLKSHKSQEIILPASLTMPLPHDYVNYVKLAWSDSAGIEHIIYPTTKTSNPQTIQQNEDGEYLFTKNHGSSGDTAHLAQDNITVLAREQGAGNNNISANFSGTWQVQGIGEGFVRTVAPNRKGDGADESWLKVGMEVKHTYLPPGTTVSTVTHVDSSAPGDPAYVRFTLSNATTNEGVTSDFHLEFIDNTSDTTWGKYKASTPSENDNDDYEDDTYWPLDGERYGLDPQHAQVNGSFFIDETVGKIHFSSNLSGQTIVLKYLSDSLGTDKEMLVHKFAEEALYKWVAYAIMSTKANAPEHVVQRLKKERFAETRKAKLRLSNIKLEELTQVLRGKSKWIKH